MNLTTLNGTPFTATRTADATNTRLADYTIESVGFPTTVLHVNEHNITEVLHRTINANLIESATYLELEAAKTRGDLVTAETIRFEMHNNVTTR